MGFPDAFQNLKWTVTPSVWSDNIEENAILQGGLSNNDYDGEDSEKEEPIQLAGTLEKPSKLQFSATRARYQENYGKKFQRHGIQLSYKGNPTREGDKANLQQVSNGGNVNGFHVVQFEFDFEDTAFLSEWTMTADLSTSAGTVISFLLSIMAVMKIGKSVLGCIIDKIYLKIADRSKHGDEFNLPHDVVLRHATLVESGREKEIHKKKESILGRIHLKRGSVVVDEDGVKRSVGGSPARHIRNSNNDDDSIEMTIQPRPESIPTINNPMRGGQPNTGAKIVALEKENSSIKKEVADLKKLVKRLIDDNEVAVQVTL